MKYFCLLFVAIWFICFQAQSQPATYFDKINDSIRNSNWNNISANKAILQSVYKTTADKKMLKQNGYTSILLGYCFQATGRHDSAFYYFRRSVSIASQINDKDLQCRSYGNIGNSHFYQGKFDSAAIYAFKSLRLAEEIKNYNFVSYKYGDLGNIMIRQGNSPKAIEYLNEALKYADIAKNEKAKVNYYNSLAVAFNNTGNAPEALDTYKKGLLLADKFNDIRRKTAFQINIATIYSEKKESQAAIEYLLEAEKNAVKTENDIHLPNIYTNLALEFRRIKEFDKSFEYGKKAELISKKNEDKFLLSEVYETLALTEMSRKNFESALDYERQASRIKSEIFSEKSMKEIENLKAVYETEKKEAQIKLLNSQNELQKQTIAKNNLLLLNNELELDKKNLELGNQNLLISNQALELKSNQFQLAKNDLEIKNREQKINILNLNDKNKTLLLQKKNRQILYGLVAFVLLSAVAYLFYNRYKLKQKAKLQQAVIKEQDEAARAVISAEENERSRMSQTLHDGLGQLLSAAKMNLQAAEDHLIPGDQAAKIYANTLNLLEESIKEMRGVSHQMVTNNVMRKGLANALKEMIEKIESNQLNISLDVNGLQQDIDPEIQLVVYRVLQESISNVIKHAKASKLDIRLNADKDMLTASVEDNGRGFDISNAKINKGIGLDNIETRIKFLKGKYNIDSSKENGTSLQFEIPL
ncbi:MAG: hypothetical protein BGN92_09700 [Sphingobacteriales bacterium 41-5]|nr:MAG: hypothetical protein BGN92_09700 [Sphingobacteriales bacterium 41-5]